MTAEFQIVAAGKNKAGTAFRLSRRKRGFAVFKKCANYNGRVHGGMEYTWRYLVLDAAEDTARETFTRALAGRRK